MQTFDYDIEKLRLRKAELGMLDAEIAKRAGVHPSTVKAALDGKSVLATTIRKIAEALGLELATLVKRNDMAGSAR